MTTTLTVELVVGSEVKESLTVDCCSVFIAPVVEFVSKGQHGRSPEQVAHGGTGRNSTTGEWHLGVAVRRRQNGLLRFEASLWKLDYDLNAGARELLEARWAILNEETPAAVGKGMRHHFGRTFFEFDATPEQESNWREALATVLSDRGSYVHVLAAGDG